MDDTKQTFELVALYRDGKRVLSITHEEHRDLSEAKEWLTFGLELELRFDLLLENYAVLERYIMRVAVNNAIFPGQASSLLSETKHEINRHMVNLLSSARLYLDQTAASISAFPHAPTGALESFRHFTNDEYDSKSSYRVMEALRNHSQHCGLPAQFISFGTHRADFDEDQSRNRYTVAFGIMPHVLNRDGRFKPSALTELHELADNNGRVAALPLVRKYLTSLATIRSRVKGLLKPNIQRAEAKVEEVYDGLTVESGEAPHVLYSTYCAGPDYQEEPINQNLILERRGLERKNILAGAFDKRYASSR
jgi:hypothetical protein